MTTPTATTPTPVESPVAKYTAAKFWVAFGDAMLVTASTIFTSGTTGRVLTDALAFVGAAMVFLWPNEVSK